MTLAYRPVKGVIGLRHLFARSFRVGGPNPNAAILAGVPKSYDSDTVDNYEAGLKATLLENRLALDVSVFHMKWKDIQARLFTAAPYYYSYVTNAGGAKIDGVEFSGTLKISQHVKFSNNTTYQEAKLTTMLPDSFAVGGGYGAGTTLPGSSKWSTANTLTFEFPKWRCSRPSRSPSAICRRLRWRLAIRTRAATSRSSICEPRSSRPTRFGSWASSTTSPTSTASSTPRSLTRPLRPVRSPVRGRWACASM
ncbi:TonB-dependent receptor domain-containing protein [Caulobacter segnis]